MAASKGRYYMPRWGSTFIGEILQIHYWLQAISSRVFNVGVFIFLVVIGGAVGIFNII